MIQKTKYSNKDEEWFTFTTNDASIFFNYEDALFHEIEWLNEVKFDGSEEQIKEYCINSKYYEIGDILDDVEIDLKYCPFCSVDEVNDDLLDFAIEKLKTTKDNLIKLYKKRKSNMNL